MKNLKILFPNYFDELFEFEVSSKGYIFNLQLNINNVVKSFNIYDEVRLRQDIDEGAVQGELFENFLVLKEINKNTIIEAIKNCDII